MDAAGPTFIDDFDGPGLDEEVWIPHYLPMWSSRAATAASYSVERSELRLRIPPDHPLWCPDEHDPPLRVSGIQSGIFSGEVGSTRGQQPFRDGLVVLEYQLPQLGWTPHYGLLEVRASMELSPRSMASVWMVGIEDKPERCGEICIFEVFGEALAEVDGTKTAAVGMGIHPFRDPALTEEWDAARKELDVGELHTYTAEWRPGRVDFLIDGRRVKTVEQAPDYPMQAMVAVFDFPDKADSAPDGHVPELVLDSVRSEPLSSLPAAVR